MRVLARQASFDAHDADALYDGVRAVAWERVLDARPHARGRRPRAQRHRSPTRRIAAQRVKDAIVDRLRDLHGARPTSTSATPTCASCCTGSAITRERAARRGRRVAARARLPQRERRGAAARDAGRRDRAAVGLGPPHAADRSDVRLRARWLIEAAQRARGIAPGRRAPFGCERWSATARPSRACWPTCASECGERRLRPGDEAPPVFGPRSRRARARARAAQRPARGRDDRVRTRGRRDARARARARVGDHQPAVR